MATEPAVNNEPAQAALKQERGPGLIARLKFMIVRGFLTAWTRCFSLKGLYLLGQLFGLCEWLLNYNRRARFRQQLTQIFGLSASPSELRRACLRHFTRTRCDKLFYLIFDKLPREKILKRIKFHNRAIIDDALARNRGIYICMSHVGSHHVCILLMALMGYKVSGVRDRNEGPLRRYVQRKYDETFPEFRDIRMLYADTYPRDIYRTFQENYVLGSALDISRQRAGHLRTATVTMFDQEREFLTGPMQIALRCKAPVIQGFVVSKKNFYFHLVAQGPLVDPDDPRSEDEVLADAMQLYADNIAHHVRQYPCHISKA